jgi:hypothetical protein
MRSPRIWRTLAYGVQLTSLEQTAGKRRRPDYLKVERQRSSPQNQMGPRFRPPRENSYGAQTWHLPEFGDKEGTQAKSAPRDADEYNGAL